MGTVDPLIVDLYVGDENGAPQIANVINAGRPWVGLCFKASEGLYYPNNQAADPAYRNWWLAAQWNNTKWLARKRLGVDFFVQQYHYGRIDQDATKQAAWNCEVIRGVGGYYKGCLAPMVDIENAENPVSPGAAAIEKWLTAYNAEIYRQLGIRATLYGNNYLAENGVDYTKCGCLSLEVAHYNSTLPSTVYSRIKCPITSLSGWQYIGTEPPVTPVPAGYPVFSPLSPVKPEDITAVVMNDGQGFGGPLTWLQQNMVPANKWTP
jgi:hypothetical protein